VRACIAWSLVMENKDGNWSTYRARAAMIGPGGDCGVGVGVVVVVVVADAVVV
jgi:hypothetical protein